MKTANFITVKVTILSIASCLLTNNSWAKSVCSTQDTVMFSCQFKNSIQNISMCSSKTLSKNRGYIYIAQGKSIKTASKTLVFRQPKSIQLLKTGFLSFAGNTGGYYYSWYEQNKRKIIYFISGDKGFEEQGLLITSQNTSLKTQKQLSCQQTTAVENMDVTVGKLREFGLTEDVSILRNGLPSE